MVLTDPTQRRFGPLLVLTIGVLSAVAIVVQIFLVGLNVFISPEWWGAHVNLGHATGGLLVLQAVVTWATRAPARARWLSLGMVLLFGLQYNVRPLAGLLRTPYVIPLHAVNALLLFWIAVTLAGWAWQTYRSPRRAL